MVRMEEKKKTILKRLVIPTLDDLFTDAGKIKYFVKTKQWNKLISVLKNHREEIIQWNSRLSFFEKSLEKKLEFTNKIVEESNLLKYFAEHKKFEKKYKELEERIIALEEDKEIVLNEKTRKKLCKLLVSKKGDKNK